MMNEKTSKRETIVSWFKFSLDFYNVYRKRPKPPSRNDDGRSYRTWQSDIMFSYTYWIIISNKPRCTMVSCQTTQDVKTETSIWKSGETLQGHPGKYQPIYEQTNQRRLDF